MSRLPEPGTATMTPAQRAILDGRGGRPVATIPVRHPLGLVARDGTLYVLHQAEDGAYEVLSAPLASGAPVGP